MNLLPALGTYIESLFGEFNLIPEKRKVQLARLADYIGKKVESSNPVNLIFICTHNSRRSQISQIWLATATGYYGLVGVNTFSGGTEATAFNPSAVAALKRTGFQILNPGGENPHYQVTFSAQTTSIECFSKTFDDPVNPKRDFGAIMTCSHVDENCPFIPGAEFRLPLTYDDPKEADGTPEESVRYDERVRQIGREIFYGMDLLIKIKRKPYPRF